MNSYQLHMPVAACPGDTHRPASRILLIGQHQEAAALSSFIQGRGFILHTSAHFHEALSKLEQFSYDAVFVDLVPVRKECLDILGRLQRLQERCCFFFMTPDTGWPEGSILLQNGAFGLLEKPLKKEETLGILDQGLEVLNNFSRIIDLSQKLKAANNELKRRQEALLKEKQTLKFLYEFSTLVGTSLDPYRIVEHVMNTLPSFMQVDYVCCLIRFANKNYFRVWSRPELDKEARKALKRELKSHYGPRLCAGKDYFKFSSAREGMAHSLERFGEKLGHCPDLPLVFNRQTLGYLMVMDLKGDIGSNGNFQTLKTLANNLSLALGNALQHDRVRQMVLTDPLTGLLNHRGLLGRMEQEWSRAQRYQQPLSILMADVDHFKSINDTYGHQAGDQLLQELGHTLSANVRCSDVVARYGGDEFIIILPNTKLDQARVLGERIRSKVARLGLDFPRTPWGEHKVTLSMGLASNERSDIQHKEKLLELADMALYRAKEQGRNRIALPPPVPVEGRGTGSVGVMVQ